MKNKKILVIGALGMACMMAFATGCTNTSKNTENEITENITEEASTLGSKLSKTFLREIKNTDDIEAVATKLSTEADMNCVVMEAKEGFLNGFKEEIKGFKKAYGFSPMIGSIPFVGYVFEVEDAAAFREKLLSVADPRWNICTEAAETVCVTDGNYVFFTMCPEEDVEE